MSLNAYLRITGATQGVIQGSVTQVGRENTIEVFSTKHLVHFPLDTLTGLPSGSKKHKPITILKKVDKSSTFLFQMLTTAEMITSFRLDFWQPNISGQEEQFYTIELTNARISSIRLEQMNTLEAAVQSFPVLEQITFTYESITLTNQINGTLTTDNWLSQSS